MGAEIESIVMEEHKEETKIDQFEGDVKDTEKPQSSDKEEKVMAPLRSLFQYADAVDCLLMLCGTVFAVLAGLAYPYFNVLFGNMIDKLNTGKSTLQEVVNELAITFLILAAIMYFVSMMYAMCWTYAGDRQAKRVRRAYLAAVLRQDIPWFDVNKPSELPTAITEATTKLQDGMGRKVGDIFQFSAQFVGGFIIAFWWCWQLTLVLMAVFPLVMCAMIFAVKAVGAASKEGDAQYARAGAAAAQALGAIRTVASLGGERREVARYEGHLAEAERVGVRKAVRLGLGNGLLFGSCFLCYALGFWYGAKLVADDLAAGCLTDADNECLTGGAVMTTFFSVLMGAMALGQTSPGLTALANARASAVRVFATVARTPGIDADSEEGERPAEVRGRLEARGLGFAYPTRPGNAVYQGFDLTIEAGQTVALVGGSGEGKSTFVALLLRFYDPQRGALLLDGRPLPALNLRWYRQQVGYVGQEPVLFSGTVRDNILNGRPGATPAEMEEAARLAHAHAFVTAELSEGYDTNVGEGGSKLSGGQKQRIAIARALVKKPKILLLDEATSALDNESEREVQRALDGLRATGAFTTLVIAHRLSTVRGADKIAVVAGGRVAECGPHAELLAREGGLYAQLVAGAGFDGDSSVRGGGSSVNDLPGLAAKAAAAAAAEEARAPAAGTTGDLPRGREVSTSAALEVANAPRAAMGGGALGAAIAAGAAARRTSLSRGSDGGAAVADAAAGGDEEEGGKPEKVGLRQILAHSRQDLPYLLSGLAGACAVGASYPVWGTLLAQVQDMFYAGDAQKLRDESAVWCLCFAALGVAVVGANVLQWHGLATVGERLTRRLRAAAFESMVRHDAGWFDREDKRVGTLTDQLSTDASKVHKVAGDQLGKMAVNLFSLFVGLGIALWASWQMALAVLAVFPLFGAAMAVNMKFAMGDVGSEEGLDGGGAAGATLGAAVRGIRTVAAFNLQPAVRALYAAALDQAQRRRDRATVIAGLVFGFAQSMMFLMYAFLFWLGAKLIASGDITFVELMTAMFAIILASFGLGQTAGDAADQSDCADAAARVFALMAEAEALELDPYSSAGARPAADKVAGALGFRGLRFAYPTRPGQPVFRGDFSLEVGAGQTVALVGPSGNGKSTVMALLLRFYSPQAGTISLDGKDIRDLNLAWLRTQVGYVGQEPVLFAGTIKDNILYGRPDAGNEAMLEAARAAHAHDFISAFERGYDTDVGEQSALLSGGQKQRVALARALIRDPKILLLDEATSALDNESERAVQEALDRLRQARRRTTLVIAHRLSTIENADSIAVIIDGKVEEQGTHLELMERNGAYASLQNA